MRISLLLLLPAAFIFAAADSTLSIHAQASPAGAVDIEANRVHFGGAPYRASRKTTHVQKLADGTTITHVTLGKEARDSEGRTYSERQMQSSGDADESHKAVVYHIDDNVAHALTSWSSRSKVAEVFHMNDPRTARNEAANSTAAASGGIKAAPGVTTAAKFGDTRQENVEKLGTKTIDGIVAEGSRTTRIIPAGKQGNDRPITTTYERWYSEELKLTVLMINDDPRTGTTTMELSDIQTGEPDAALFKAPEGYEIRERTPGQVE